MGGRSGKASDTTEALFEAVKVLQERACPRGVYRKKYTCQRIHLSTTHTCHTTHCTPDDVGTRLPSPTCSFTTLALDQRIAMGRVGLAPS